MGFQGAGMKEEQRRYILSYANSMPSVSVHYGPLLEQWCGPLRLTRRKAMSCWLNLSVKRALSTSMPKFAPRYAPDPLFISHLPENGKSEGGEGKGKSPWGGSRVVTSATSSACQEVGALWVYRQVLVARGRLRVCAGSPKPVSLATHPEQTDNSL